MTILVEPDDAFVAAQVELLMAVDHGSGRQGRLAAQDQDNSRQRRAWTIDIEEEE